MERSNIEKLSKVDSLCWELFSKTGKIAYYGACASVRDLKREYEKGDVRERQL